MARALVGSWLVITNEVELERELAESKTATDRRVGQDLHDRLGQSLAGIACLGQVLLEEIPADHPELARRVEQVQALLQNAQHDVSRIARGLCPIDLERDGLAPALRRLVADIDHTASTGIFRLVGDASVLDATTATQLYGIAQEAVANALKHADAMNIEVRLLLSSRHFLLTIRDDGNAFDVEAVRGVGLGLRTMAYRARSVGAELHVGPSPRGGTRVACIR